MYFDKLLEEAMKFLEKYSENMMDYIIKYYKSPEMNDQDIHCLVSSNYRFDDFCQIISATWEVITPESLQELSLSANVPRYFEDEGKILVYIEE